jgi:hypothetical protein
LNIGCRFYLPEEIFLKAKTLEYPFADSFRKTFPGLITQGVISLCKSKFKSNAKKSKSKKKIQSSSDIPEECDFLKQFKKYKLDKKIEFSLRQIFRNGKNFSEFLDSSYIDSEPFFDLEGLNRDIKQLQSQTPEYKELQKILTQDKIVVLMFGFQGSGKSYFCREHLGDLEIISNVRVNRMH